MPGSRWRPLLAGRAAVEARRVACAISDATTWVPEADAPGAFDLAAGAAGRAVFQAYAARARGLDARVTVHALLEASATALTRVAMPVGLFGGVAGISWAHRHLETLGYECADTSDIDGLLLDTLRGPAEMPHDLVDGVVGLGVYGLERGDKPAGRAIVAAAIERLATQARWAGDGCAWSTSGHGDDVAAGRPRVDLGLAHGVPGVLAFLAAARRRGHACQAMVDETWRWLRCRERPVSSVSAYGTWDGTPQPSRLAWCYGDAGVAAALYGVAEGQPHVDRRRLALRVARRAAARTARSSGASHATFCHGSAGVAHIMNRLWQASGDRRLQRAAITWMRRTLSDTRAGLVETGLLEGAAGVGLVLLAAAGDIPPSWDRAFLLPSTS